MYMFLCAILFWPSKIETSLSLMQNVFKVWEFKENCLKSYFWEIWVQYNCFWIAFHLIFMHFIHKILCFEEFLHKIALFFKKIYFSRFSINRTYCLTNWNCDKKLVWICLFRSVLDRCWINQRHFRSIKSNFRSIENHIESF